MGLVSTSLQAIGLTLQRKSHLLEDEKPHYEGRRPPYKRRRWQLGMGMFVISNIVGSTIQITTLPLPVLSTLQAVSHRHRLKWCFLASDQLTARMSEKQSGLVFNTIFATLILGEPFTRYSFAGTGLVCIGAILIATFGAIGEPAHTLNQLLKLLMRRPFLIWMGMTLVVVGLILVGSKLLRYCIPGSRVKPTASGVITPHVQRLQGRVKLFRGMCYGAVSGILSAHSLLLAKSAVELLVRTVVDRVNQFNRWQSWVILLGMIALALTQLFYLHRGLKLCSTSVLYPFVFCIYNIIAILDGLIYFRQASQLAGFHAGLIALGTIILLGGVLCLSWRLEDVDSNAGVSVSGPTQTGIGPGMAVVEEHDTLSPGLLDGLEDEESRIGEREPLLHGTFRPRHLSHYQRARAPSLPFIPTMDRHEAADLNAASIWAELDDSDDDDDTTDPKWRSSFDRPRSSSGGAALNSSVRGLSRHSTIGAIPHHRPRGSRRPNLSILSGQRRSSAPLAGLMGTSRRWRGTWGPVTASPVSQGVPGYGTIQEDDDPLHGRDESITPRPRSAFNLLAGSRRTLVGAWRNGRQYITRWTNPRAGSQEHHPSVNDDARDGASSPLLPRAEVSIPRAGDTDDHHPKQLAGTPSSL